VRTLRTTGFDRIVAMTETLDAAKEAFEKPADDGGPPPEA
jgi:hypothetical protein